MNKPYKEYYYDKELIHVYSNDSEVFEYLDEPAFRYALAQIAIKYAKPRKYSQLSGKQLKTPYREIHLEPYKDFFDRIGVVIIVGSLLASRQFFIRDDNMKAELYRILSGLDDDWI